MPFDGIPFRRPAEPRDPVADFGWRDCLEFAVLDLRNRRRYAPRLMERSNVAFDGECFGDAGNADRGT